MAIKYVAEPFRIKMVETIKMTTSEERAEKVLFPTFLKSEFQICFLIQQEHMLS